MTLTNVHNDLKLPKKETHHKLKRWRCCEQPEVPEELNSPELLRDFAWWDVPTFCPADLISAQFQVPLSNEVLINVATL